MKSPMYYVIDITLGICSHEDTDHMSATAWIYEAMTYGNHQYVIAHGAKSRNAIIKSCESARR
jgi:hypothetical protein